MEDEATFSLDRFRDLLGEYRRMATQMAPENVELLRRLPVRLNRVFDRLRPLLINTVEPTYPPAPLVLPPTADNIEIRDAVNHGLERIELVVDRVNHLLQNGLLPEEQLRGVRDSFDWSRTSLFNIEIGAEILWIITPLDWVANLLNVIQIQMSFYVDRLTAILQNMDQHDDRRCLDWMLLNMGILRNFMRIGSNGIRTVIIFVEMIYHFVRAMVRR